MAEKEVKDPKDEGVVEAPATSAAPEAPAAPETPEKDGAGESSAEEKGKKKKGTKKTRKSAEETPRDADVVETTEKHEEDGVVVETTTRVKTDGKGAGKTGRTEKKKKDTNKKSTKKTKKPIVWWPWILAGGMVTSAIILCLCGRCRDRNSGCRDCERPVKDTTEIVHTPDTGATCVQGDIIHVGGDAIIVKGNDNDVALVKGNENHVAQRSTGGQCKTSQPRQPQKPLVVHDTVRVEVPKEEPVPEKPIKLTLEATQYEIMVCRSY